MRPDPEAGMSRRRVGILVYPDVEVLDFTGPFEVFSCVRLDEARRREEPSPFEVLIVAEEAGTVTATGGLKVVPDHDFATCPPLDLVVVPGGWGTRRAVDNTRLTDWLWRKAKAAEAVASVCTGSFLVAKTGLLDGKRATTHWKSLDRMRETFPSVTVDRTLQVVDEGKVVTSAGVAAGIDLALRLVARFHGEEVARRTARHMEYPYPEDDLRRVKVEG